MIQNYIGDDNKFIIAWRKVLKKAPIDFITHLAITTQKFDAMHQINSQNSPIHVAAIDSSLDFYKQMMVQLADMNKRNIFGDIHDEIWALIFAAGNGKIEIYKDIAEELGDKNPARFDGVTPLYIGAQQGHYEICKFIVANVDDKNPARPDGVTPLFMAAQNGHYEICKLIISNVYDN